MPPGQGKTCWPGLLSTALIEHHDQRQFGDERNCRPGRHSGQEPGSRNWTVIVRNTAHLLAHLAFLYNSGPFCLGMASSSADRMLPRQSLVKKVPHRPAYRPVRWRHFLNWSSPFPDDPSLPQANSKPNQYSRVQTLKVSLLQVDFDCIVKGNPSVCRRTPSLSLQIRG